ncbi:MAG: thioredoxin-disulfide reductase [Eubacteriales bacterium]|nr:thioredoxin-disulfide reductase [Eubacteriales bacterium]
MEKLYDVIILGAGPAGLAAAIYAGRSKLSVLLIEKGVDGGQISATDSIENYPGQMIEDETGVSLSSRMGLQADKFGVERVRDSIHKVELEQDIKVFEGDKAVYRARYAIIATGAHPRPIGCENEETYRGQGISYCATCDANFFTGLDVYVAGGGDAAVEEAIYLTRFAKKVTIIHRRDQLRAAKIIQERAFANPKIDFIWDSIIESANGKGILQGLTIKNVKTGQRTEIEADPADGMIGLFGFVGNQPNTVMFQGILELDERGYIKTDEEMHTNIEGVFAAGDVRQKSVRQVITAAADGAIAAVHVSEKFI